jgi:hypothetical protein
MTEFSIIMMTTIRDVLSRRLDRSKQPDVCNILCERELGKDDVKIRAKILAAESRFWANYKDEVHELAILVDSMALTLDEPGTKEEHSGIFCADKNDQELRRLII